MSDLEQSILVFNRLVAGVLDSMKTIESLLSAGIGESSDVQSIRARLGAIRGTIKPLRGLVEDARAQSRSAQQPPRPRFGEQHPVEAIRGLKRPSVGQASKIMIDRLRHLQDRIASRSMKGDVVSRELDEMAAILVLFDEVDAARGAR